MSLFVLATNNDAASSSACIGKKMPYYKSCGVFGLVALCFIVVAMLSAMTTNTVIAVVDDQNEPSHQLLRNTPALQAPRLLFQEENQAATLSKETHDHVLDPNKTTNFSCKLCCDGPGACAGNTGKIGDFSCNGPSSCVDNQGEIGQESCNGPNSCDQNKEKIPDFSCNSPKSCNTVAVVDDESKPSHQLLGNSPALQAPQLLFQEENQAATLSKETHDNVVDPNKTTNFSCKLCCDGPGACAGNTGKIGDFGPNSCLDNAGEIGRAACNGQGSCDTNKEKIPDFSCNAPYACNGGK